MLAIPKVTASDGEPQPSATAALKEGFRFVRGRVWLWGTLLSAAFGYLLFLGPAEVRAHLIDAARPFIMT